MTLYPGKRTDEISKEIFPHLVKKMTTTMFVLLLSVSAIFTLRYLTTKESDPFKIRRNEINGAELSVDLILEYDLENEDVSFTVYPTEMTEEEIDSMQTEIESVLMSLIPGNSSDSVISDNLYFPESLPDFPVHISWSTDNLYLIAADGTVNNSGLTENSNVTVCAKIRYGDEFRLWEQTVTVAPPVLGETEMKIREAIGALSEAEIESRGKEFFEIPHEIFGVRIEAKTSKKISVPLLCFVTVSLGLILGYMSYFSSLAAEKKRLLSEADSQFRDFASKVMLLTSAGMSLRQVWKKLGSDCNGSGKSLLDLNLSVSETELETGTTEIAVFENFGERMELAKYKRLSSILVQSVTKGVRNLPDLILAELTDSSADAREKIRVRGEQAGTGLLFPMMGLLLIVFSLVLVPTLRSL